VARRFDAWVVVDDRARMAWRLASVRRVVGTPIPAEICDKFCTLAKLVGIEGVGKIEEFCFAKAIACCIEF